MKELNEFERGLMSDYLALPRVDQERLQRLFWTPDFKSAACRVRRMFEAEKVA